MVETRRLKRLVEEAMSVVDLPPEDHLVLALSGGADSAALGYLLREAGRRFRCCHVHHGRPASDRLAEAASAVARKLGCDLEMSRLDLGSGHLDEGRARNARYLALHSSLAAGEVLLTAHTRDDQAETVLLNLLRGTGSAGLAGIPHRVGPLARPLLAVTRSQTRELATLAGLAFVDDPANSDPAHRRNLVRLELLPTLSSRFNPRLSQALARTAAHLAADEAWLGEEAARVPILEREDEVAVPVGALAAVARPIADRVLRACMIAIRPPYPGTSSELERVRRVGQGLSAGTVLGGGISVERRGPLLVFTRVGTPEAPAGPVRLGPGVQVVAGLRLEVDQFDEVCRVAPIGPWRALFPSGIELTAAADATGRVTIAADGVPAWQPGVRRLPVAWYRPGTRGYLSLLAMEESRWT